MRLGQGLQRLIVDFYGAWHWYGQWSIRWTLLAVTGDTKAYYPWKSCFSLKNVIRHKCNRTRISKKRTTNKKLITWWLARLHVEYLGCLCCLAGTTTNKYTTPKGSGRHCTIHSVKLFKKLKQTIKYPFFTVLYALWRSGRTECIQCMWETYIVSFLLHCIYLRKQFVV